ncbi:MAG: hypothetical protein F4Y71_12685 [Acidobacteria bacterium]|nr:hypothetical protein [Acidobacteriota bacterium]
MASKSVVDFQGTISVKDANEKHPLPASVNGARSPDHINRVIAIDGSVVSAPVRNGYPGAEAALLRIAAVVLDLDKIRNPDPRRIPRPSEIREMEQCDALDAVLPGRNVTERDHPNDSPRRFFRRTIFRALSGPIEAGHESLLDTLTAITSDRTGGEIACPVEDCSKRVTPSPVFCRCPCARKEGIYPTDALRLHERFDETGSNGQVFTLAQQVTEHLALVNILRYCEKAGNPDFIRDTAFIMDGPLALFGMSAWLHEWIGREVRRIHTRYVDANHPGVLLVGVEKTGQFLEHLKQLDWSELDGPGTAIPNGTALAPSKDYTHQHIVNRPAEAKDFGSQTYYGRKVLYKNRNGQHSVVTTPIVNPSGEDKNCIDRHAFPRLGETLNILDDLATYLYEDGFAPLVRAHAHAAIPLKAGTEILHRLFSKDG